MKFEDLQQEWRKEMASTTITGSFSFEKIAKEANEINREHRFAALLYAWLAVAILLLGGFILITDIPRITFSRVLQVIGIPLIYAYCAVLYFRAVKDENNTDWTLAAKLKNEQEKLKRQINLNRKLPTHMLLPLFVIIMIGIIPGLFYKVQNGTPVMDLAIYLVMVLFILALSKYGLNRAEKKRLTPVLAQLQQLEAQLQDD